MAAVIMIIDESEPSISRGEVDVALEAWARWAKSAFTGIGWPTISLLGRIVKFGVRGAAQGFGAQVLEIDTMCELVDRAILRLDETEREVIVRTYLENHAAPVKAQRCRLTYQYYRNVLSRARQRIGDIIFGAGTVV
jgi:hypothetical protein